MINRNLFYLIAIFYVLNVACEGNTAKVGNSDSIPPAAGIDTAAIAENKDSISPESLMSQIDSLIEAIRVRSFLVKDTFFPPNELTDTLKTALYFEDSTALRLTYSLFEDGGQAFGSADFYFNDAFPLILETRNEHYVGYEVLTKDLKYLSFRKDQRNGEYKLSNVPVAAVDYRLSDLTRKVRDLVQLYPGFRFHLPDLSFSGSLVLKIITPVQLYEAPDTSSKPIYLLPENSKVGFIKAIAAKSGFKGKEWIWYQVKFGNNTGWIIGHPDFVQELTDENAD